MSCCSRATVEPAQHGSSTTFETRLSRYNVEKKKTNKQTITTASIYAVILVENNACVPQDMEFIFSEPFCVKITGSQSKGSTLFLTFKLHAFQDNKTLLKIQLNAVLNLITFRGSKPISPSGHVLLINFFIPQFKFMKFIYSTFHIIDSVYICFVPTVNIFVMRR